MAGETKGKVGAVLVVGAGVGGMQTSLDLAESGFKVYLVEKSPSIGGVMAQLDKTFPTDDCAMCTLSPRMVDCGGHMNIEKLTYSDVESLEGESGNFRVYVRKKPRYVDEDKCTGCGECAEICPIEAKSEFDEGLNTRKAIYKPFPQAIPNIFAIEKKGRPACRSNCPADIHTQGYITLVRERRFKEAIELLRSEMPLPSCCGRVCYQLCEEKCERTDVDAPIAIKALKRFVADWAMQNDEEVEPLPVTHDEKVAVIGAGPAGLACANDLARRGYAVSVFEAAEEPGGMLRYSIPEFRLPRDIVKWEIDRLVKLGIEINTGSPIDDIEELKNRGYKAVFIAIGAQKAKRMSGPGEELNGVMGMLDFLKTAKTGNLSPVEGTIAVIGGGNSAMDAARVALRMGAKKVVVLYRRSRAEMPAHDVEVEEAQEEGIEFEFLSALVKVEGSDGRIKKMVCQRMELGEQDDSGRRRPVPVEGSEFEVPIEMLILAIGQDVDMGEIKGLTMTNWGGVEADQITLEINIPGVFAGGDLVTGAATVVEAFGAGKRAAESIDRYLQGMDMRVGRETEAPAAPAPDTANVEKIPRVFEPTINMAERTRGFDEVVSVLSEEDAIAEANRCLECGGCSECFECLKRCEASAIDHNQTEQIREIEVGAVVLAPGYEQFDPDLKKELGYARFPNVLSSLQFERILSSSGPYQGQILRPSDGEHPKKIAWIQCVGSREVNTNYCSSVCCMYATKEAIIGKEHEPDLDCTIFFIDMRAFGKGFDAYYNRAKELGVKYVRCRPSSIKEVPGTKNLKISYQSEDGESVVDEFNMVVLSTGLRPPANVQELGEKFRIDLNQHGFAATQDFTPVATSNPGIFVCGTFSGPKDIPETVTEASASASQAMALLAGARGTLITEKEYPPEKDVSGQEARIGVFVCHCGKNIAGVADVVAVAGYAKTLPNVVYTEDNMYTCSTDTQEKMKEMIKEHDLNRVIVASCSPRTHEPVFRNTCREAGLNEYLFEMANIRDQCTWVHMLMPEKATEKAKHLVRMAVAKARLLEPLYKGSVKVNHAALVVGGGMAGITAALNLADQGFEVHLVEKEPELGGNFRRIHNLLGGGNPQEKLNQAIEKVTSHSLIQLHLKSMISAVEGSVGNFESTLTRNGEEYQVSHGVAIVATGAVEHEPTEYLYGEDSRIITQSTLEGWIAEDEPELKDLKSVVMIQCVGSREETRPYCSRVCCSQTVKNAMSLKAVRPDVEIYVLYRDMRTYGLMEEYYREARDKNIRFIRFEEDRKPQVSVNNGALSVSCVDPILKMAIKVNCDALVLAPAIVPRESAEAVGKLFKVPLNQDRFFLEAHMKLKPIEFATDGVFMCGLTHSPKSVNESIAQAGAAAAKATMILSRKTIEPEAAISEVVDKNCDGCAYCIDPCPYGALTLIEYMRNGAIKKTVERNEVLCKGCGVCMATCPKQGIFVRHFKMEHINAMVDAALEME
ncbi:MAG: FAD-dependent oxidoreductase [Proteobacteria bacterium]|nr:FAD-dependent oxidoreductase [Pseudomonadota bacterium]